MSSSSRFAFLLAAMGSVWACADVTEPDPVDVRFAANPVVQSVSGSGSLILINDTRRTFSFTAQRHADGSVTGQWERIRRDPGNASDSKSHGVVTCFEIVGNVAWLGGMATSGLYSEAPNNETYWRVADNGQGQGAVDQMSLEAVALPPGSAVDFCADQPDFPPLVDIANGNIQVDP